MRKRNTRETIRKVTATETAERLAKGMGKPAAKKLAENTAKNLAAIDVGDVNSSIASIAHIRKQERFWTEVKHILAK